MHTPIWLGEYREKLSKTLFDENAAQERSQENEATYEQTEMACRYRD